LCDAISFFWAPWNYFLLGILLLGQQSTKIGVDVARTPHPQTKNFEHTGGHPGTAFGGKICRRANGG
jgi:hypothetical protein